MIYRDFVWTYPTTEPNGRPGFRPRHMLNFDPSYEAFAAVHDILEHISDRDESVEAEFLAFGSMLYWRAETDYWGMISARTSYPGDVMWNDVFRFVLDSEGDGGIADPGRTHRLNDELEDIITDIRANTIREAHDYTVDNMTYFTRNLDRAIGWMRKGYRKNVRRWGKLDLIERLDFFYSMELAIGPMLNREPEYTEMLRVEIDRKELKFRIYITDDPDAVAAMRTH
jgi:hypothetical protein